MTTDALSFGAAHRKDVPASARLGRRAGTTRPHTDRRAAPAQGLQAGLRQRGCTVFWVLTLALGVAGAQMASFGREHVHIDEHAFIVMAAHVLDGGLPNVDMFDFKPPLFFYLLAGAFAVFGETLGVARLFGDFAIFALCVATFGIAQRWTGPVAAGLGALLVVAATAGDLGQATLTDFPAMALLMGGLWALFAGRRSPWLAGCAGFLASAAVLARLNLWVSAAAMGAWLAFCAWGRSPGPGPSRRPGARPVGAIRSGRRTGRPFLAFSMAALALPALFVFLYWRADALADLRFSMIDLPLSYSAQKSVTDQVESLFTWVPRALLGHRPILTVVFAVGGAVGIVSGLQRLRRPFSARSLGIAGRPASAKLQWLRRRPCAEPAPNSLEEGGDAGRREGGTGARPVGLDDELLLALMAGAFGAALLTGGAMNDQYVFWCVPLGAVYAARGVERAIASARGWCPWPARMPRMVAVGAFAVVVGLLASALHERATQPRPAQSVRLAAEAIAADRQPGDGVWPLDRPIASWYLEADPLVPLAFPWHLQWPAMMRPLLDSGRLPAQFLQDAMETAPAYLLLGSDDKGPFRLPGFFYDYDAAEAARLADWVQDNYALFYDAHGVAVYKAKDRS